MTQEIKMTLAFCRERIILQTKRWGQQTGSLYTCAEMELVSHEKEVGKFPGGAQSVQPGPKVFLDCCEPQDASRTQNCRIILWIVVQRCFWIWKQTKHIGIIPRAMAYAHLQITCTNKCVYDYLFISKILLLFSYTLK